MVRVTYNFTDVAQSTDGHTQKNGVCNIYIPGTLETSPYLTFKIHALVSLCSYQECN